jgi:hypothetical protein
MAFCKLKSFTQSTLFELQFIYKRGDSYELPSSLGEV